MGAAAGVALAAAPVATDAARAAEEPASGNHGKPAASITYRVTDRPDWVPGDFVAPPGVRQTFLAIEAIDGFVVDAVFFEPEAPTKAATSVIKVHGSGSNYLEVGFEMPRLSSQGYAVLSINTRQHDSLRETDNFMDVRRDIEAAFYTALDRGYKNIVLDGHSLGTAQVAFYAATNWDQRLRGVILAAAFANLPWKSRNVLIQNEDEYQKLFTEALQFMADGKQDQVLPTLMHGGGGSPSHAGPVTAQHFLSYRREFASAADTTYWIKKIPRPILMLRGDQDTTILNFEPNWILENATKAEGSIVPSMRFVSIPGAGHSLRENPDAVIEAELTWLRELGL